MSFWKQDPPKPTEALRNLGPIRLSVPIACDTCIGTLVDVHITSSIASPAMLSEPVELLLVRSRGALATYLQDP